MTLSDVLREVLRRVAGGETVTIARDGEHAYQIRFTPDRASTRGWRSEGRRWMDGTEKTPTRGTAHGHVGWAHWSTHLGWQVDAVLADDWRIL